MNPISRNIFLICLTVALLGACQPKSSVVDFNKLAADKKTEAAERLLYAGGVYPSGFMHANRQFDEALKLNPNDPVARFYKATLAPLMLAKGIISRISTLVPQLKEADLVQYNKFKAQIPAGDLSTFLFDGKPDINDEKDVQEFVRSIQESLRSARQVYFDLSKQHVTLHVTRPKAGYTDADVANKCKVTRIGLNAYSVETCDIKETKTVVLSYADFEALRLEAAATIIYLSAATSYDLTGLIEVLNTLKPKENKNLSDAKIAEAVSKENQLGKLVDVNVLKEVLGFGSEGVAATKIALVRQKELCPVGTQNKANRPGKLIEDGICVDSGAPTIIAMIEKGLVGATVVPFGDEPGSYQATIDATKPLNGSITDLKSEMPRTFDACGNATSIPDNTLGGLFPNNDATPPCAVITMGFLIKYANNH